MNDTERTIGAMQQGIQGLNKNLDDFKTEVRGSLKEIRDILKEMSKDFAEKESFNTLTKEVEDLKKFRWTAVGIVTAATVAASYVFSYFNK